MIPPQNAPHAVPHGRHEGIVDKIGTGFGPHLGDIAGVDTFRDNFGQDEDNVDQGGLLGIEAEIAVHVELKPRAQGKGDKDQESETGVGEKVGCASQEEIVDLSQERNALKEKVSKVIAVEEGE